MSLFNISQTKLMLFKNLPNEFWYVLIAAFCIWIVYMLTGVSKDKDYDIVVKRYTSWVIAIRIAFLFFIIFILSQRIKNYTDGSWTPTFIETYLGLATLIMLVVAPFLLWLLRDIRKQGKYNLGFYKAVNIITILLSGAVFVVFLVIAEIYNRDGAVKVVSFNKESIILSAWALAALVLMITAYIGISDSHSVKDGKALCDGLFAFIISAALAFIPFKDMLNIKYSIGLALAPIVIYSFRYGVARSLILSVLVGAFIGIFDVNIISPVQYFVIYPILFGVVSLVSSFAHRVQKRPFVSMFFGLILIQIVRFLVMFGVNVAYMNPTGELSNETIASELSQACAFDLVYSLIVLAFVLAQKTVTRKFVLERENNLNIDENIAR